MQIAVTQLSMIGCCMIGAPMKGPRPAYDGNVRESWHSSTY